MVSVKEGLAPGTVGHQASAVRKQSEGTWPGHKLVVLSSDPLPVARLHFPASQTLPPADQVFKHVSLRGTLHIHTPSLGNMGPRIPTPCWK